MITKEQHGMVHVLNLQRSLVKEPFIITSVLLVKVHIHQEK